MGTHDEVIDPVKEAYEGLVMDAQEVVDLRHRLRLTINEFAILTGTAAGRTVRRWETGEKEPPGSTVVLLWLLADCDAARQFLKVGEWRDPNVPWPPEEIAW